MFTTKEAVQTLLDRPLGLTLKMINNPNFHIFKCVSGLIYQGEIGGCCFSVFNVDKHPTELWEVDYETSTI